MSILLHHRTLKNRLLPFLFTLFLSACTTNFFSNNEQQMLLQDANASSDFYMNKVSLAQSLGEQNTYKLLAARVMLKENKINQARALLSELAELTPEQMLDESLIKASIFALQQKNTDAETLLFKINLASLSASQSARYYEIISLIAQNRYDVIAAVQANIKAEQFFTDIQRKQDNINRTWNLLRQTNQSIIDSANPQGDAILIGWLKLASVYKQNLVVPSQLGQSIKQWRNSHPNHPASYLMPHELQDLLNFQQTQINQVALLLPIGGSQLIGSTIQAGFEAAKGDSTVVVQVFDTMSGPIEELLTQIKQAGINTVIGPLQKRNVDMLINNPELIQGLNILALNSTSNEKSLAQMCYYGLSPEDEAESAANRIWNDGSRNPLVFVPQNDLGQRTAKSFNTRWQRLAATDANIRFYSQVSDIRMPTQNAGAKAPQAVYVMLTSPEQLAEVKTIADNNKSPIKLYSNSRGHSGNTGPEFRILTEGVLFSDIPLFMDSTTEEYKTAIKLVNNDYSLLRLYAMGADAWKLINHFNELRQLPDYQITGLTGKLSAGRNCNIERDMTWFQYQNGNIIPLN